MIKLYSEHYPISVGDNEIAVNNKFICFVDLSFTWQILNTNYGVNIWKDSLNNSRDNLLFYLSFFAQNVAEFNSVQNRYEVKIYRPVQRLYVQTSFLQGSLIIHYADDIKMLKYEKR